MWQGRRQPGLRAAGWRDRKGPREGRHKEQVKLFGDDSSLEYFSLLKNSKSYYLAFI